MPEVHGQLADAWTHSKIAGGNEQGGNHNPLYKLAEWG
jgi:hypothetical protein